MRGVRSSLGWKLWGVVDGSDECKLDRLFRVWVPAGRPILACGHGRAVSESSSSGAWSLRSHCGPAGRGWRPPKLKWQLACFSSLFMHDKCINVMFPFPGPRELLDSLLACDSLSHRGGGAPTEPPVTRRAASRKHQGPQGKCEQSDHPDSIKLLSLSHGYLNTCRAQLGGSSKRVSFVWRLLHRAGPRVGDGL